MLTAKEARAQSTRNRLEGKQHEERELAKLQNEIDEAVQPALDKLVEDAVAKGKDFVEALLVDNIDVGIRARSGSFYLRTCPQGPSVGILNIKGVDRSISVNEVEKLIKCSLDSPKLHARYASLGYDVKTKGILHKWIIISWKQPANK